MVKRGDIICWMGRAVRLQSIPMFPYSGCAHVYGIEPGWAFTLQQQTVSQLLMPCITEGVADERSSQEASADMIVSFAHQFRQALARMLTLPRIAQQTKLQCQRVGCFGVADQPPVGRKELRPEGRSDLLRQLVIACFFCAATQQARYLSQQFSRTREVCSCYQTAIGTWGPGLIRWRGRIEPVTKLKASIPQMARSNRLIHIIHPGAHTCKLHLQDSQIARALIEDPGHYHRRITPAGCREIVWRSNRRDDDRHQASQILLINCQIGQPGGQEAGDIIEKSSGWSKDLNITSPAQPFGALRAVGRYVQEVVTHAPHHVHVQAVE